MKYRAFLSYSHADSVFAERFHGDLERWRAGRGLLGRETPVGPVPATLRPIFRDRDDFAGGGGLADATNAALEDSDFLVLLCSPSAAKSPYVNEEVRSFKAMGGSDRIIPVIVDGEPGHPELECFPPALTRKVGEDGQLTDEVEDRLAADAREVGDGPRRALAKVIAGLLGVPFDEIVRRAEQAQRRRNRTIAGVAVVMGILAVLAGAFGWLAESRRVVAERNYQAAVAAADSLLGDLGEELIRTEGVTLATTRRLLGRSEAIYDRLLESLPDALEVRMGKMAALGVFARAYYNKGDVAGALAALDRAEALTVDLVGADTAAPLAMIRAERAALLVSTGKPDEAVQVLEEALAVLAGDEAQVTLNDGMRSYIAGLAIQLAVMQATSGKVGPARDALRIGDAMRNGADRGGDDFAWRMLDATTLSAQAAIEQSEGRIEAAYGLLERSTALIDPMVAERPDYPQVRGILASNLAAATLMAEELGRDDEARALRERADGLTRGLAAGDEEDRVAQLNEASRLAERAAERLESGNAAETLPELRAALGKLTANTLVVPGTTGQGGELPPALKRALTALNDGGYHAEALGVAAELIRAEDARSPPTPSLADSERLLFALAQAERAEDARGNLEAALHLAERSVAIERRLAAADPSRNAALADVEWRAAVLLWRLSRREEAEQRYVRIVELYAGLAEARPNDLGVGSNLSWTCVNLGELMALNGRTEGVPDVFAQCLANAERLLAMAPDDRQLRLNLAWATARVALVSGDTEAWRRTVSLLESADREAPLADLEEEVLTVARLSLLR